LDIVCNLRFVICFFPFIRLGSNKNNLRVYDNGERQYPRNGGIMQALIDKYKLIPHPEGGYYAVVHESEQSVKSPVVNKDRKAITHIYFLLLEGQASIFHKVAHDEIWNFYEGDPLKLVKYNGVELYSTCAESGASGGAKQSSIWRLLIFGARFFSVSPII
jgi:hypothetical protein